MLALLRGTPMLVLGIGLVLLTDQLLLGVVFFALGVVVLWLGLRGSGDEA